MSRLLSPAFLPISWLALISLLSTSARCDEPEIWGQVIMKQPFDSGPFQQVRVPPWVQGTTGCGYTLSAMDSKARATAAAHGVTISELGPRLDIHSMVVAELEQPEAR
jgi:hypothetical protein